MNLLFAPTPKDYFDFTVIALLVVVITVSAILKSFYKKHALYPKKDITEIKTGTQLVICAKEQGLLVAQTLENFQKEIRGGTPLSPTKFFLTSRWDNFEGVIGNVYEVQRLDQMYYLHDTRMKITSLGFIEHKKTKMLIGDSYNVA